MLGHQVTMSEETVWQGLAAILPIFHWTVLSLSAVHIRLMRPSYTPPQLQLSGIRDPRRDYPFENLSVQCGTTPNN